MRFKKINKLMVIIAITLSILIGFGQTDFARGSSGGGHFSGGGHSSSSSSVHSGSFSSPKSSSTSSKSSGSTKSGSFSSSSTSKPSASYTRSHVYTAPKSTYHYIPNTSTVNNTYINNSGSSYMPSFWSNYFLYRAITGTNTGTVIGAGGTKENVNYGTSGIWKDILTLIVIGGVITGIVLFIKKRK